VRSAALKICLNPCSATSAEKRLNSSWTVEHPCPQCGAPVQLAETDRVLSCGFCRVRHLLMAPGFFQFCLLPRLPRDDVFFVPYWHVRGMAFTCANHDVRFRVIDTSRCASDVDFAPPTLGLRPQAMKLRFASADGKAFFISRRREARDLLLNADAWQTIDSLSRREQVWMREFIGETGSTIYAPFYYKNKTYYDAVLDRPVHCLPADEKAPDLKGRREPGPPIAFAPAMCPQCGWDLEGEKESCVFICRNCESAWESGTGKLKPVSFSVAKTSEKNLLYVPFWRMQARIEGIGLESFADLVRFANLPKALRPEFEQQRLSFWAPAFKIKPNLFLRMQQQLTVLQPDLTESTRLKNLQLSPASLPESEAAESIKITLAGLAIRKHEFFPLLESISVRLTGSRLVFLPFRVSAHDFIQTHFGFSLSKNAFNFGKKI
jgi:predicted RNA-binding Zn-ribbon protein involved in translation (DUF1610 family)